MKHSAKKIEAGEYEYRGFTISRNTRVSPGYWNAWRINMTSFETKAQAMFWVDNWHASYIKK